MISGKHHLIGGLAGAILLLGLAGCSPETDVAEPATEPVADNGLADFEPNGTVSEVAEPEVPPEEPAAATDAFEASHDATDSGEDMYRRGLYAEAIAQWESDAEAGDAYAAYRLGVEYFDASQVERDIPLAARYQQLASELGNEAAMFELASFYEAGLGVPYDIEQAGAWYLASAQRGYPPAQHNVATMFEDGVGQPQDLVQAYLYYSLALAQGFRANFAFIEGQDSAVFSDPTEHLEEIMSAEQLAEAQALIESFQPIE